jgi:hypothetical protein
MTSNAVLRFADRIGCSLSVACAIHCLATPVLLTVLSISPVGESAELPMMIAALVIAAATFSAGFVRRTTIAPLLLLLVAGPVMIVSRFVQSALTERGLLVAGAVLLVIGHVLNLRGGHDCAAGGSRTECGEIPPAHG